MGETLTLLFGQTIQMFLVLLVAPAITGITRRTKARFMRRQGAPVIQPYRDLIKLVRKEAVIAENASWFFRSAPYAILAFTWVAAALVPTFASGLMFNWAADAVALVALLGAARALLALAGMDVGTSFGGIGSSREMMIATLAEPAMLLVVLTMALSAGTTRLPEVAEFFISAPLTVRVSLALALVALIIVALAENARIPVDNPATHLELTMVHEAMVLEYSGRHLAMIEVAAQLKLVLYISLIVCLFLPFGMAPANAGPAAWLDRHCGLSREARLRRRAARRMGSEHRQDAGVPCRRIPRRRLRLRLPRHSPRLPDPRGAQ